MRIQHNIMAMSAYRNYTNNVSAMKKNLEKLSSGYKINRAGDDAAGLAISEKMRAQITGLETAQKNAKDGISLVQTAEGALTEVHDMLNRMVELATMSANGTYDNTTDRAQLQKEMDQLTSEIDRIADSSNFNGIKLLNGDMDAGGETTITEGKFQVQEAGVTVSTGNMGLPKTGNTLGTDTVLHKGATAAVPNNEFSVELHNVEFSNAKDAKIEIAIGGAKFTFTNQGTAGDKMDAAAIAESFAKADTGWAASGDATSIAAGKVEIEGVEYTVAAKDGKLTFTSAADLPDGVTIPKEVTVKDPSATTQAATASVYKTEALVVTPATPAAAGAGKAELKYVDENGDEQTVNVASFAVGNGADAAAAATALVTELKKDAGLSKYFDIAADGAAISLTAKDAYKGATVQVKSLTIESADTGTGKDQISGGAKDTANTKAGTDETTPDSNVTGDYNKSTTDIVTKAAAGDKRLASTHFTLTSDMVGDGSSITIGTKTYTFTTDKDKIGEEGYVDATSGDLAKIAENLTDAVAKDNTTYTLGTDATAGHITITEIDGQTDFDLTTIKGIEESLGFKKSVTAPTNADKGLTLQIGDTADSFNQLKVSIKDMHAKSLGIDGKSINIKDQKSAADAVDKIKAAINQVSDVRGTLGATQNRLDHTINNLSVMTENIQDAESTIRDVDVAEEMMAYTKNNILIQSAQAMLAQANQVPQGVLQLLQ